MQHGGFGLRVGQQVPPHFLQTLNRDEFLGLFRGNVTKELGHGIPYCKHPNVSVLSPNILRTFCDRFFEHSNSPILSLLLI